MNHLKAVFYGVFAFLSHFVSGVSNFLFKNHIAVSTWLAPAAWQQRMQSRKAKVNKQKPSSNSSVLQPTKHALHARSASQTLTFWFLKATQVNVVYVESENLAIKDLIMKLKLM